ncbi:Uncharacterised protein [Clostridioides difficile]|nr:Uncharacterised protein [Clostridioides difficile]
MMLKSADGMWAEHDAHAGQDVARDDPGIGGTANGRVRLRGPVERSHSLPSRRQLASDVVNR